MNQYQMYIDGSFVDASDGRWFETQNPYTGKAWAEVARGTEADVDRAVKAADMAFRTGPWAEMTATQRGALLRNLGDLIARNSDRLAEFEVQDNGKLFAEMSAQLRYLPQWFYYFGGLADKVEGSVIPLDKKGYFNYTRREPLGVVAAITPWNSPLMLLAWKIAPALAAGCTVVGLLAAGHIPKDHGASLRAAGANYLASDYLEMERIVGNLLQCPKPPIWNQTGTP